MSRKPKQIVSGIKKAGNAIKSGVRTTGFALKTPIIAFQRMWARRRKSPYEFLVFLREHREIQPNFNNVSAWKEIIRIRLKLLGDSHTPPVQKLVGMSRENRGKAELALAAKNPHAFALFLELERASLLHELEQLEKK
ncbi:MAG: hypothetical protein AABX02_04145 [archaeon]